MVMRSMLEHLTLVAWLSIEPAPPGPDSSVGHPPRTRDEKARWWVADQCRRDQRHLELQHRLIRELDADTRADIKTVNAEMKEELAWGVPPGVERMAKEADAAWGGRLSGWASAEPGEVGFPFTVQGFYLTLYTAGSRSTHPSLGHLMGTFLEHEPGDRQRARLVGEPLADRVSPLVGIVAFLLLYGCSVAELLYGGSVLDDALRDLGRFDVVRGPGLLLSRVAELVDGTGSRRFGVAGAFPVSVEKEGAITTVVLITSDGWERIVHAPGPVWTYDDSGGAAVQVSRLELDEAVAAHIVRFRERLRTVDWTRRADEWPDSAP